LNRKLVLFALACAVVAAPAFASSYVVPPDDVFVVKSDAAVVAVALNSYVVERPNGTTVTINRFAIEASLKGFEQPPQTIDIETPGGIIDGRGRRIVGSPTFNAGLEYLLFLQVRPDGGLRLTDFGLGVFTFGRTPEGHRTLQRGEGVFGWNLDGTVHRELQRDADGFLDFVRAVGAGKAIPTVVTYEPTTAVRPSLNVVALSFTGTSYTSIQSAGPGCVPAGCGARWNSFPVNWNQGNTEAGAPGTPAGKTAISTAFASWAGAGVGINYVYHDATAGTNTNGVLDPPDGVNNIVFEKNLSQFGGPYSCASGGLLGVGGPQQLGGTNVHNGETYFTTTEADVSMNQGIANCSSLFSNGDFNTAVTHELGHTLGLRHSDQTRADNPSVACSTDSSLDCSNSAVMRAVIPHNLSGALQTWDSTAVQTIYGSGPACSPAAISVQPVGSTISQGASTSLSVTATGTSPFTYQWYVGSSGDTSTPTGTNSSSINVSPSTTTSYWVKVTNSCNLTGANSNTATVTVTPCNPPGISVQPVGSTITQGNSASLSVTASGTSPFTYKWYVGNPPTVSSPVPGGTTASISVSPSSTTNYWVQVNNSCGPAVNSNAATVTVNQPVCNAPQITTQPSGSAITFGSSAQLSVVASGTGPLTYQWYTSPKGNTGSPVFNGTAATIVVNPQSTTSYWVRVSNSCGTATADSNVVTVTVNCLAPQVTVTPGSRTINAGSSTLFSSIASGGPNMTFQWYQGIQPDTSTPLVGQTGTSVTVSPTTSTSYWVQASVPGCGTANSNTVSVTVNPNNGCPPVTIATPTATQNGASYTLSTTASTGAGGGTVTITWFQQTSNGQVNVGTGPSIVVTPTVTTSYFASGTNTCGASNGASVTVTIAPTGCTAPVLTQPTDQTIGTGASTTIIVVASGSGTLHYQWYRGLTGDTTVPVGIDAASLTTGALTTTSTYWVKVTNDCSSSASSGTVTVTVEPARRRSVHH
jgi:hypothetical protein